MLSIHPKAPILSLMTILTSQWIWIAPWPKITMKVRCHWPLRHRTSKSWRRCSAHSIIQLKNLPIMTPCRPIRGRAPTAYWEGIKKERILQQLRNWGISKPKRLTSDPVRSSRLCTSQRRLWARGLRASIQRARIRPRDVACITERMSASGMFEFHISRKDLSLQTTRFKMMRSQMTASQATRAWINLSKSQWSFRPQQHKRLDSRKFRITLKRSIRPSQISNTATSIGKRSLRSVWGSRVVLWPNSKRSKSWA